MNENIQLFNHAHFGDIRAIEVGEEPWFVAKDICNSLGYANASKAINDHVDDEDKLNNETLSSLGQRGGWLINESGMYSLILHSRLPQAKAFKRWVTHEVLPIHPQAQWLHCRTKRNGYSWSSNCSLTMT